MQTHLFTRIHPIGKAGEKIGTEYPDSVRGAKAHSFRKAFPSFTRVTGAPAPIGKNIHLTVPFLRRGFAPRSSVSAFADRVPYALFTSSIIINLFAQFVNTFTQKRPLSQALFALLGELFDKSAFFKQNFDVGALGLF